MIENEMYYQISDIEAKKAIDHAIFLLNKIKNDITESNFNHYHIDINQSRKIEPFYNISGGPLGFRQLGPDRLVICIENSSNLGKELVSKPESEYINSPWESPTKKDAELIDENLKELLKTGKKSKKGGLKLITNFKKKQVQTIEPVSHGKDHMLDKLWDTETSENVQIEPVIHKRNHMNELTIKCAICGKDRTEDKISVLTFELPVDEELKEITIKNIPYCSDNKDCEKAAKRLKRTLKKGN